jgi:hypothetical protein
MRKFLILAFIVFSLTGYFTVSHITASRAQFCIAGGEPCIPPFPGTMGALGAAMGLVDQFFVEPALAQTYMNLEAYFAPLTTNFYAGIQPVMQWSLTELTGWVNTFWHYNLLPEMRAMTSQLHTADVEQVFQLGMFADAANIIRGQGRNLGGGRVENDKIAGDGHGGDLGIEDHRALRPSEKVCTAGTLMSAMERANAFSDQYLGWGVGDKWWLAANASGTQAAHGFADFMHYRWWNNAPNANGQGVAVDSGGLFGYVPLYCNVNYNKGYAGCIQSGSRAGNDVDVAGMVFAQDTIPLDHAQDVSPYYNKSDVDELVVNLGEPFDKDPVTAGNAGRDGILNSLSYRTKRQVVYDSLFYVITRRVPGGFVNGAKTQAGGPIQQSPLPDLLAEIRAATGEDKQTGAGCGGLTGQGSCTTGNPDPSRNEIFRALIAQRFQSGKYALGQIDTPENNAREQVIDQALQLMQMSDQLDLMDHYSLLLSAQISGEVVQKTELNSASPGAPLQ